MAVRLQIRIHEDPYSFQLLDPNPDPFSEYEPLDPDRGVKIAISFEKTQLKSGSNTFFVLIFIFSHEKNNFFSNCKILENGTKIRKIWHSEPLNPDPDFWKRDFGYVYEYGSAILVLHLNCSVFDV